jgi:hypothetical protein
MSKLTGNNKDFLFKVSTFFKGIVLEEEVDILILKKKINNFTRELIDDGVIDEDSEEELRESFIATFSVMIDNRKEGMYGKYFGEEE